MSRAARNASQAYDGALVILAGDLASLVACRREQIARERQTTSALDSAPKAPHLSASLPALVAWIPQSITGPNRAAARAAAAWCRVTLCIEEPPLSVQPVGPLPIPDTPSPDPEHLDANTLLRACKVAQQFSHHPAPPTQSLHQPLSQPSGLPRVVWPVQIDPDQPTTAALDRIADALDRASLVGQLALVEHERLARWPHPANRLPRRPLSPGPEWDGLHAPLIDFTDSQLVELALDLGVPLRALRALASTPASSPAGDDAMIWACSTIDASTSCGVCAPCRRWRSALDIALGAPASEPTVVVTPAAALKSKSK